MEQVIKASPRIGNNIRNARKAKGLTQEVLAARLQVNGIDIARYTLARIETGSRHIAIEELEAIKAILDMDYADFFKK